MTVLALVGVATSAEAREISLLRDAGTEHALEEIARPVLTAAGLPARRVRILVVNNLTPNAFVVNNRAIFVTAGLILHLDTPEQLQAVIAHEAAHIANGHIARRGQNLERARRTALGGLAVGLAAGAAVGRPDIGIGVAFGTAGTATRTFLSHTQTEEASADRSALFYLARAGLPPSAMADVMQMFANREAARPGAQSGYTATHPLSRERLRAIQSTVADIGAVEATAQPTAAYWFGRAQAKLSAYLRAPAHTARQYPAADRSDAARIARAMAAHKQADLGAATAELDALIAERPDDAFLHEMKGWIAHEAGRPALAQTAYAEAAALAPTEPLILSGYGRALLARDTETANARALEILKQAHARDRYNAGLLRDLGVAHARAGEPGLAALATAERYALAADYEDARVHAHRAAGQLPTGSPGWSRAQDIIREAEKQTPR